MGFGKDTQSYIQMKILYTQLVRVTIQKTGFLLKLLGKKKMAHIKEPHGKSSSNLTMSTEVVPTNCVWQLHLQPLPSYRFGLTIPIQIDHCLRADCLGGITP
nr:uncharacterized protein LOC113865571 isoform X7 [Ipomoea batatas]GMD89224.1 uncharacterized protein LOC113865571 isoform X7 [Ipomoea batatas]